MSNYSLIDDNNHKKMSNNQQTKSFDNKANSVIETISGKIRANGALSNTLTSQELYLPNMAAYNIAEEFAPCISKKYLSAFGKSIFSSSFA